MSQTALFFGFPVDANYANALANLNPKVYQLFIDGPADANYLQSMIYHEQRYLGKRLGHLVDCAALELLQVNIYSVLKKLVPGHAYEMTPLRLIPILQHSVSDARE